MSGLGEEPTEGEARLNAEFTVARWAFERALDEWKMLYLAAGMDPDEQEMYLDAVAVVESGGEKLPMPGDEGEVYAAAFLALLAREELDKAMNILIAELVLGRGPEVLDRLDGDERSS